MLPDPGQVDVRRELFWSLVSGPKAADRVNTPTSSSFILTLVPLL